MRAAILLAAMGLSVFVIEKEKDPGGWALQAGRMGPEDQKGTEVVSKLLERIKQHENIMLHTGAEVTGRSGSIGDFTVTVKLSNGEDLSLNVGAIVAATGFKPYEPAEGEYGWGLPGVIPLLDFRQMLSEAKGGKLEHNGKPVRSVSFIYCVGSRQSKSESCPEPNAYCSRYCCTATTHTANLLNELDPTISQYHLYRDVRTYGALELVYEKARTNGARFLRWDPSNPPTVSKSNDGLSIAITDLLASGSELEIGTDLVVLATGMEPRDNDALNEVLKIPESTDGFYKEIHIKLRPVETVIDGVFIAGAAQGPKMLAESVASALSAVAKAGGLLKKGYVDLEPLVAKVDTDACIWCDECLKACPYGAIEKISVGEKEIAFVIEAMCKGEGGCVPVCPHDAIEIEGYRDDQIKAMIEASIKELETTA
jgi:heterodisulfide reductase subunit A